MGTEMTCLCLAALTVCLFFLLRWKPSPKLSYEEGCRLMNEVTDFLVQCGGIYEAGVTRDLEERVLYCLATEQYLLSRNLLGRIVYFYSYWKILPEDIVIVQEGNEPSNKVQGPVLCIVDFGNPSGEASAKKAERVLKQREGNLPLTLFNHAGRERLALETAERRA